MSRLRFKISISIDGYVAGPRQSVEHPLGVGGNRLHQWAFALETFRARFGMDGGEVNASTTVVEESQTNMDGGTTFTFVTDGPASALEQARQAAGGRDDSLAGGAAAARQYLAAGLVDEMELNVVPTLLGAGERLFDGIGDDLHGLALRRTVRTPRVVHLTFARHRRARAAARRPIRLHWRPCPSSSSSVASPGRVSCRRTNCRPSRRSPAAS